MTDFRALATIAEEADYLAAFVRAPGGPDIEALIDRHIACRDATAAAMRDVTDAFLATDEWALDIALEQLEAELRSRLAGVIPLDAITIRRYGQTHRKLYQYLFDTRRPVPATRLRVLTGDQVHTERRIRELRDIGLQIDATHQGAQNVYELVSTVPNFGTAVARFAPEFAKRVPGWSAARRADALAQLGLP